MPLYTTPTGPLYFSHVPRTGGSNLEDYLEARFGTPTMLDRNWMRSWVDGGWRSESLLSSPQHVTAADAVRLAPPEANLFAIVRDPVTRIQSEFRFQARRGFRRRRLTELGFSTWLGIAIAAAQRDPRIFDNHLRPQADMVPTRAEVFRLEAGHDDLVAWLDALTGTTAPSLSIGKGEPGQRHLAVSPSAADLRLISRFYASDYRRFGYPVPGAAARNIGSLGRSVLCAAAAPMVKWMYFRGQL